MKLIVIATLSSLGLASVSPPGNPGAASSRLHMCSCVTAGIHLSSAADTVAARADALSYRNRSLWFDGTVVALDTNDFKQLNGVWSTVPRSYDFSVSQAWRLGTARTLRVFSNGGAIGCPDPVYTLGDRYLVNVGLLRDSLFLMPGCDPKPRALRIGDAVTDGVLAFLGPALVRY